MMKQLFFIALAFILASCSSEVEKYIEKDINNNQSYIEVNTNRYFFHLYIIFKAFVQDMQGRKIYDFFMVEDENQDLWSKT